MVYVALKTLTCETGFDRLNRLGVMRIGFRNYWAAAALGLAIAFIAKDLAVPLLGVSVLGLVDRVFGVRLLRAR